MNILKNTVDSKNKYAEFQHSTGDQINQRHIKDYVKDEVYLPYSDCF